MNKYKELAKKLTPEQNRLWAIACAELVLPIFEDKYPNDDRPRLAIEAAKNKSQDVDARAAAAADAAWAARNDNYDAVWAADWAAYSAAYAAIWAANAAILTGAYASDHASDHATYWAAYAADDAEKAGANTEEILQLGEKIREQV
jgi:hypothetical protein